MNPHNATYYSFVDSADHPKLNDTLKFRDGSEYVIVKTELINDNLEDLDDKLNEEKLHGRAILFDKFYPFRKRYEKLTILKDLKLKWKFHDFQNLSPSSIDAIQQLFELERQERSEKIKAGQKNTSKALGNPNLKQRNNSAVRGKMLSALNDRSGIEVKAIIVKLKEQERLSFNKITGILNEQYKHLCKGKKFYRTSVERFYNDAKDIFRTFTEASVVLDTTSKNVDNQKLIIENLELDQEFENEISFKIKSSLNEDFQVVVQDAEEVVVFRKDFDSDTDHITIDLEEHKLLQGYHYLSLFPLREDQDDQAILAKRIILRPSFREIFAELVE